MKINVQSHLHMLLLIFVLTFQFSCSKDSDLLADLVLSDSNQAKLVDDIFVVSLSSSVVLDVLSNDTFGDEENITITETSTPRNGTVEINNDNTLTYTPDSAEETDDIFTYTTEVVNENAPVKTETGNVIVTTSENRVPIVGDNTYFVTTSGKSKNDGGTESTAWSIKHAFATARAGDIIYVKAGNYGPLKLSSSSGGTVDNPIKFIGYKTVPGDIVSTNGPTWTKDDWIANGQELDASEMPVFDNDPINNKPVNGDKAIKVTHSYVEVHNFMARDYWIPFDATGGTNIVFDNLVSYRSGDWDPNGNCWNGASAGVCTNNNGYGIFVNNGSDYTKVLNCLVIDAGHIGIYIINADNVVLNNSEVYSYNPGNATDYYIEFAETTGSSSDNCYGERTHTLASAHTGRSFAIKCGADGNTITNFRGHRSKFQVVNADGNTFKNIKLTGQYAEFQIYGEADDNIIENLSIDGGYGISFLGWFGTECGYGVGQNIGSGSNNYFINPILKNAENASAGVAVVSYHRLDHRANASAGTNYIVGGTFSNYPRIFNVNRTGTMNFTDSSFSNIYLEYDGFNSGRLAGYDFIDNRGNYTANYTNCSFSANAFTDPIGN